jgi:hypothetical protein
MKNTIFPTLLLPATSVSSYAQRKVNVDLTGLQKHHKLTVLNRDISVAGEGEKTFLKIGSGQLKSIPVIFNLHHYRT